MVAGRPKVKTGEASVNMGLRVAQSMRDRIAAQAAEEGIKASALMRSMLDSALTLTKLLKTSNKFADYAAKQQQKNSATDH